MGQGTSALALDSTSISLASSPDSSPAGRGEAMVRIASRHERKESLEVAARDLQVAGPRLRRNIERFVRIFGPGIGVLQTAGREMNCRNYSYCPTERRPSLKRYDGHIGTGKHCKGGENARQSILPGEGILRLSMYTARPLTKLGKLYLRMFIPISRFTHRYRPALFFPPALTYDAKYIKALDLRAGAYEILEKWELALNDYASMRLLEEYKTEASLQAVDRIVKQVGKVKATELFQSHSLILVFYALAYMDSFRFTSRGAPEIADREAVEEGDVLIKAAFAAAAERKWVEARKACIEGIETGKLSDGFEFLAYNLRGTFGFLMGD
ncbi:hypothetical protein BDK51DRAFT_31162, partial [Blyttiomyces helicus]